MDATNQTLSKTLKNFFVFITTLSTSGILLCSALFILAVNNIIHIAIPIVIAIVFITASIISGIRFMNLSAEKVLEKLEWHEAILDAIPFPLSITDNDRNWTFVNYAVEQMLGKTRPDFIGKQCKNWGAGICGTDNCGINCLQRNKLQTTFEQGGGNFQVDTRYLVNSKKQHIGHIEIVQDISKIIKIQEAQSILIRDIHEINGTFIAASKNVADASQSLAEGSTAQASAVEELTQKIMIITDETTKTAEMAKETAELTRQIMTTAIEGNDQMKHLASAVSDINDANQSINNIIDSIDDIATQTNLLSLNAAIEAARAGSQGAGFSVVASQVRVLAGQSAESAGTSKKLIDNSIEKAKLGVEISNDTSKYLQKIVDGIKQSNEMINKIAKYSDRQKMEIEKIKQKIEKVSDVVQQTSATSEETAATSQELSEQTESLNKKIEKFDV